MEAVQSSIIDENSKVAISRIDENTFADKTSGRLFRRYQYFDFDVIQDIETGFINAGSFVMEIGRLERKKKDIDMFRRTNDWNLAIELGKQMISRFPGYPGDPNKVEIESFILRVYQEGFGNDVKGSYVPYRVFQLVALWADKKHKLAILELLENINENAYTKKTSAYDEMKHLNEQLVKETEELKASIKAKDETIELKESLIQKLTRPVDKLASPEAIYAAPVGGNEFQLRYQKQPIVEEIHKPARLAHINIINAREIKNVTMRILEQQGLLFSEDGKRVLSRDNLALVFSIIESVSKNEPIQIPLKEYRDAFLLNQLNKLATRIQTGTVVGKIYERRYELENESLIPWEVIPIHIINKYNETNKDNGFDAVVLNEAEDDIIEAYQIKHSSRNDYVQESELSSFINKCQEPRYEHVQKHLILHNCRISLQLQTMLNELGVIIETLREDD